MVLGPVIDKSMFNPQDHIGQKPSSSFSVKEIVLIIVKILTATMTEVPCSLIFQVQKNYLGSWIRFALNNSQVEQKTLGRRKGLKNSLQHRQDH